MPVHTEDGSHRTCLSRSAITLDSLVVGSHGLMCRTTPEGLVWDHSGSKALSLLLGLLRIFPVRGKYLNCRTYWDLVARSERLPCFGNCQTSGVSKCYGARVCVDSFVTIHDKH